MINNFGINLIVNRKKKSVLIKEETGHFLYCGKILSNTLG
jgi:hypothetical protein